MLLFKTAQNRYIALKEHRRFPAGTQVTACFDGREVPAVLARAFVRQYGGHFFA